MSGRRTCIDVVCAGIRKGDYRRRPPHTILVMCILLKGCSWSRSVANPIPSQTPLEAVVCQRLTFWEGINSAQERNTAGASMEQSEPPWSGDCLVFMCVDDAPAFDRPRGMQTVRC